jgi:hypothetical protein
MLRTVQQGTPRVRSSRGRGANCSAGQRRVASGAARPTAQARRVQRAAEPSAACVCGDAPRGIVFGAPLDALEQHGVRLVDAALASLQEPQQRGVLRRAAQRPPRAVSTPAAADASRGAATRALRALPAAAQAAWTPRGGCGERTTSPLIVRSGGTSTGCALSRPRRARSCASAASMAAACAELGGASRAEVRAACATMEAPPAQTARSRACIALLGTMGAGGDGTRPRRRVAAAEAPAATDAKDERLPEVRSRSPDPRRAASPGAVAA